MNKKKEIVPKLRFPEFANEDKWKNKRIEQLLTIGNGCDYKHLSKGDIPVYGSGGYMCSVDDFLYDGDSVCIGRKGTIDKPIFLRGKFWTVDTLFYTHSYKNCIPKFIYNIFQRINWLKYNEAGGVPSLSKTTINKINIYIPKIPEQQKIADCLSSIDELIDAESRKLKALEKYKKGLLQKLFPAEGKNIPEWRFPECKNTYEIKRKRLADVCYYKSSALTTNDVKMDGKYNLYDANKIIGKVNIYASEDRYITIIKDGAGVGRVRLMDGYTNFVGTMGMINNNEFVTIDYLYYLLQTIDFRVYAIGGTIPHIYFRDYSKKEIFLPHIGEQQKITDCLSEIDKIITEQSNKVEQLKAHKKGLMQGLFPSLEEADV